MLLEWFDHLVATSYDGCEPVQNWELTGIWIVITHKIIDSKVNPSGFQSFQPECFLRKNPRGKGDNTQVPCVKPSTVLAVAGRWLPGCLHQGIQGWLTPSRYLVRGCPQISMTLWLVYVWSGISTVSLFSDRDDQSISIPNSCFHNVSLLLHSSRENEEIIINNLSIYIYIRNNCGKHKQHSSDTSIFPFL